MRARTWAIMLGVSVALNLFFLGLFSARVFQRVEARPDRHGAVSVGPRRAWQRSRSFEWMSEAERADLRPRRKELRGARHAAEEALRAEPFDAERLRRSLSDLRQQTEQIQANVHERMLERAASMSPEERKRLADTQWGPNDRR
jgi:uncharacterized membrane protein